MNPNDFDKFIELLDQTYTWPDYYTFKFIIKFDEKERLLTHLEGLEIEEKISGKGNYISITARILAKHSNDIVEVYRRVSVVKGVICL